MQKYYEKDGCVMKSSIKHCNRFRFIFYVLFQSLRAIAIFNSVANRQPLVSRLNFTLQALKQQLNGNRFHKNAQQQDDLIRHFFLLKS